jgi:hypothetical protein
MDSDSNSDADSRDEYLKTLQRLWQVNEAVQSKIAH